MIHAPTLVELEIINEARTLLDARCPNLPLQQIVVMNASYEYEHARDAYREMRVPLRVVHKGALETARQMLIALSHTHGGTTSSEWLANIILTRVARLKEDEERKAA